MSDDYEIKPVGEFSPKLKEAMAEIKEVIKKHDIGGVVILNDGLGHGEFGFFLEEPTWSVIRFMEGGRGVHVKAHMKTKTRMVTRTTNMIFNQLDLVVMAYGVLDKIKSMLSKHTGAEELGKKGKIRPHVE